MQYKNKKTLQLIKILGKIIKEKRLGLNAKSRHNFCNSYELDSSNMRRIENGEIELKITMLWRIAESLDIKPSELLKYVENELGEDFHLIEQ